MGCREERVREGDLSVEKTVIPANAGIHCSKKHFESGSRTLSRVWPDLFTGQRRKDLPVCSANPNPIPSNLLLLSSPLPPSPDSVDSRLVPALSVRLTAAVPERPQSEFRATE